MCIIIVNKEGKLIKDEILIASSIINPHGLGITWLDTYETEYSLSSDWGQLRTNRPYLAHFRYATIGKVSKENTHPFPIKDYDCMLYQNGSVMNLGDDDKTDAQHMAEILNDSDPKHWEAILEMNDCRWALVDKVNKNVELFNEELFIERDKVEYSKENVLDKEFVAVYGTLKKGFGNHHTMGTSKLVGKGKTVNKYPMVDHGIPFVLPNKGEGHNVVVEVYMADKMTLEGPIDRLEGHPSNYCRQKTLIELEDGTTINAWLYFYSHYQKWGDDKGEYIAEFTRGYSKPYEGSWKSKYGYQSRLGEGYSTWGDDVDYVLNPEGNDYSVCDKCGHFDTKWDTTSNELFCNTCNNYTTSEDIVNTKPF